MDPVDTDRFLVAHLILKTDIYVVAALDHLLGCLSEARLVAIDRRNAGETGQEAQECDREEHHHRAGMGSDGEVDDGREAARRSPLASLALGRDHHVRYPLSRGFSR